jgi:hypothetical protein
MAKIETEGEYPKRVGDYLIYDLNGQIIMRAKSGFTSHELKHATKYEKSRNNATEFGHVVTTCKHLRWALQSCLPKTNNLLVVNALTKKMRQLLTYDTTSAKGQRHLAVALSHKAVRSELKNYHFNPATHLQLQYTLNNNQLSLATNTLIFPEGANVVGCRVLVLDFDFTTTASQLEATDWYLYTAAALPKKVALPLPKIATPQGVVFTLLEVQFYTHQDGSYVPVVDDSSKVVLVVDCSG